MKYLIRLFAFPFIRLKYNLSLKKNKPSDDLIKDLDILKKQGILIKEDFISKEECLKILNDYDADLKSLVRGDLKKVGKHWRFEKYGVYRLLDIQEKYNSTDIFFKSSYIDSIAKSYHSKNTVKYQNMIEIRPDLNKKSIADRAHFDDWRIRLKAFLYLTDVSDKNAPLKFVKRSNEPWYRRLIKEINYFVYRERGTSSYYSDEEIQKYKIELKNICSSAGTLILLDTKYIHSGSPLLDINNPRVHLASYYDIRGGV